MNDEQSSNSVLQKDPYCKVSKFEIILLEILYLKRTADTPTTKKHLHGRHMKWNIDNIVFLHQPEYFLGTFDIPQMQERHEKELKKSLLILQTALANEAEPLKALRLLNKNDHVQFLLNNIEEFRKYDQCEEAVISLYSRENAPFSSGGDRTLWEKLFSECDATRLKKFGKPLPANVRTVYRGSVSGVMRSLAWTPDRKIVEKFASRWEDPSLGGGELYEVDISPDNVLVYMQKGPEEIVILSPDYISSAAIRRYSAQPTKRG